MVSLFVNGTLMRGGSLHANLDGATFRGEARTLPLYRLFSVRDVHPAMMAASEGEGVAVSGEMYELSLRHLQRVLEKEPPGLGVGVVNLEGDIPVLGILWTPPSAPDDAIDISAFGGWREYMACPPARSAPSAGSPHSPPANTPSQPLPARDRPPPK